MHALEAADTRYCYCNSTSVLALHNASGELHVLH